LGDLDIYISIIFSVRDIYIPKEEFIANGLLGSLTTLVIATWRIKVRNVIYKEFGLRKPDNLWETLGILVLILAATMISLVAFNIFIAHFPWEQTLHRKVLFLNLEI